MLNVLELIILEFKKKIIHDVVHSQRWEDVESSITLPLPSNLHDFLVTQAVVVEYHRHVNEFRDHLENFVVAKLTQEIRHLKEDTKDFYEVATRLDSIRDKKRKRREQFAAVLERAKNKSIEAGTYRTPQASIISRALARKGFADEQDILDQALEFLRRDGKKFTHHDIPSIRKDNFNQKFRAIFFNGSLKPMDKARMVALTISNFIVSTDELKVATASYEIMSRESTEEERQQKEMKQSQGDMSLNLDYSTVSFNNKKAKNKVIEKKEGEISFEGYNTSDFENQSDLESVPDDIPAEFDALSRFKPHAKYYKQWASVVDEPIDESNLIPESQRQNIGNQLTDFKSISVSDSESEQWSLTDDDE